jgi:hypothetical protein
MTAWDPLPQRIVGEPKQHRPGAVLRQELAAIERERPGDRSGWDEQLRGAAAALVWVLGETDAGPISGEAVEMPTWQQSFMEGGWAEEVHSGIRPMPLGASGEYANGVWFGIAWAWEVVEDPPVPLED